MNHYKRLEDIKCPFCLKKMFCENVSVFFPDYYCVDCKVKVYFEQTLFGRYKLNKIKKNFELCKKHNKVYAVKDKCGDCEMEDRISLLRRQKFTKSQLQFILKSDWQLSDDVKKLLHIKDDEGD